MSQLSEILSRLSTECVMMEEAVKENWESMYDGKDEDLNCINTMVSQLQAIEDRFKHGHSSLKHCEGRSAEPEKTAVGMLKTGSETPGISILDVRYKQLHTEIREQKKVLAWLWDTVLEPPDISESDIECNKILSDSRMKENVVILNSKHTCVEIPCSPAPGIPVVQERLPAVDVISIHSDDSGTPYHIQGSVQEGETSLSSDIGRSVSCAPDPQFLNKESSYTKERRNTIKKTRRLEVRISNWNRVTAIALKTGQCQTLTRQQVSAKELLGKYQQLELDWALFKGGKRQIMDSRTVTDLKTALATMTRSLADITNIDCPREELKLPQSSQASFLAMGREHSGQQGASHTDGKGNTTTKFASAYMSFDQVRKLRHKCTEKTRFYEKEIYKWLKDSEDIMTEFLGFPIAIAKGRVEGQLERAQRLEEGCLMLDIELERRPSLAERYDLGSQPFKRLTSARELMGKQVSALEKISLSAESFLRDFESDQAHFVAMGKHNTGSQGPVCTNSKDSLLRSRWTEIDSDIEMRLDPDP